MEIFVMSAAGIYDWPIIKQVSWLLGQVMNGIYNALSAIGIENIGLSNCSNRDQPEQSLYAKQQYRRAGWTVHYFFNERN